MIVDLYAGPGGWSEGLRALGLVDIGWEIDEAACATRAAAGHKTIRADVATWPLDRLVGRVDGIIASPPCQAFSTAGKGTGREVLDELVDAVARGDWGWSHDDDRVRHVLEVGRWVETIRPRWVACEQVPPALPVWAAYADRWRHRVGWSTWAGVLNAADWGVPQTRRRAFLIARTDGANVAPPEPTHCEGGALTLFGELRPWVSMADALGWSDIAGSRSQWVFREIQGHGAVRTLDQPAMTIPASADNGNYRFELWPHRRPATTVAGDPRITARCHHDAGSQGANAVTVEQAMTGDYDGRAPIKLSLRDALILQGFPADYPVQGGRTKQFEQVGNAVPPPLAAAVVAAVTRPAAREGVA